MSKVHSFRLNDRDEERFEEIYVKTGRQYGEVIRAMLRDPKLVQLIRDAEQRGYERGMNTWFGKAYVPCKVCGKNFTVDFIKDARHREVLLRAFAGWTHTDCLNSQK
jgi:hypothetical protein